MRLPERIVSDDSAEVCSAEAGISQDESAGKDKECVSSVVELDGSVQVTEPKNETASVAQTPRASFDGKASNGLPPLLDSHVDQIFAYTPGMYVEHAPPCSTSPRMRQEIPVCKEFAGPAEYHRFYWNCMELKSELIRLDFSLRSLGSSGPSIQATNSVKCALKKLRDLYGMNTAFLFPDDLNVELYKPGGSCAYLANFSCTFNDLGDALDGLARALYGFNTVYHDEKLMLQLYSLHTRFKAEARAIFQGYNRDSLEFSMDVQVLLDDWVDSALSSLKEVLSSFHDKGIPAINYAQDNITTGYLTLTTIAFFLSGATASMLQVSADDTSTISGVAANSFLFSSLVFSIGSAVNSLLVMGWHKSIARVADTSLPLWLRVWLNAGPMVSLLVAGAFFAVALCLSAFSTDQHTVTSAITITFSGIHVSGFLFLSGYFILQTWKFRQNAGAVGRVLTKDFLTLSLVEWTNDRVKRLQIMKSPRSHPEAIPRSLEASLSVKAYDDEKGTETQATDEDSQAVWHALSDEKFLLNSTFVTTNNTRRDNNMLGADADRTEFTRSWNRNVALEKGDGSISFSRHRTAEPARGRSPRRILLCDSDSNASQYLMHLSRRNSPKGEVFKNRLSTLFGALRGPRHSHPVRAAHVDQLDVPNPLCSDIDGILPGELLDAPDSLHESRYEGFTRGASVPSILPESRSLNSSGEVQARPKPASTLCSTKSVKESEPASAALHDRISSSNAGNIEASSSSSELPPPPSPTPSPSPDQEELKGSRQPSVEASPRRSPRQPASKLDSAEAASRMSRSASLEPKFSEDQTSVVRGEGWLHEQYHTPSRRSRSRSRSPSPSPPTVIVIRRLAMDEAPEFDHRSVDESAGRSRECLSEAWESRSRPGSPLRMHTRVGRSCSPSYRGPWSVRGDSPYPDAPLVRSSRGRNARDSGERSRSTSGRRFYWRASGNASADRGRRRSRSVSPSRERMPRRARRSPSPSRERMLLRARWSPSPSPERMPRRARRSPSPSPERMLLRARWSPSPSPERMPRRARRSPSPSRERMLRRARRSPSPSRERMLRRARRSPSPSPPPPAIRGSPPRGLRLGVRARAPYPPPPAPPGSVQAAAAFLPNVSRFRVR